MQGIPDSLQHTLQVLTYVEVPESQDCESLRFEPFRSNVVIFATACMTTAIKFDDQLPLETYEVDNVRADRSLAPKFAALQLSGAKALP